MGGDSESDNRKALPFPDPPTRPGLTSRFRKRDSMGALRPRQAELDAAFASGYARGEETAFAETLDRLRTVLCSILEVKFGELQAEALDRLEGADQKTLERWLTQTASAETLEDVFGPALQR